MRTSLIVTFIGHDAPGLVGKVAAVVTEGRGNWLESRSTQHGGRYAGLVRVGVDDADAEALRRNLTGLSDADLHVAVEPGEERQRSDGPVQRLTLDILGLDRAGITHEVTQALAGLSINLLDLRTSVFAAPMSGEQMFQANALVECRVDIGHARLQEALDGISHDLGLDVELAAEEHT